MPPETANPGALPPLATFVVNFGGPSLVLTLCLLVVLPLVYWFGLRRRVQGWPRRVVVLVALWGACWLAVHGDVLWNARAARERCLAEGGLKVYRQVEAEGFIGQVDLPPWAAAGFGFIEHEADAYSREEMVDGKARVRPVESPRALYRLTETSARVSPVLNRISLQMQDRLSGEVLGEVVRFELYPGWVDRQLMASLGGPVLPFCVGPKVGRFNDFPFMEDPLIAATLRPPGKPPVSPPQRPWR